MAMREGVSVGGWVRVRREAQTVLQDSGTVDVRAKGRGIWNRLGELELG
jgi:hypothetical protein